MTSTLTQLAAQKTALDKEFLSRESVTWLKSKMEGLKSPTRLAREIVTEKGRNGSFQLGGLYHFYYNPLTKNKLPYYDSFPLVIPLNRNNDGFLGLNLHYLPVNYRANFLDRLMPLMVMNSNNEPERVRVTYEILKTVQSLRDFKPCIKRYLDSQIRSRIIPIQPNEWEVALFLPTAIFNGASSEKIYRESISKIKAG
jgi:hypothetical protein